MNHDGDQREACPRCHGMERYEGPLHQGWHTPGLVRSIACARCGHLELRLANAEAFKTVRQSWDRFGAAEPSGE